jgi:hypothetical protein
MPAERTIMRQVREVFRLKFVGGVPTREIARRIGVAPSTVRTTIKRFQAAGLSWPLPDGLTDAALEASLFPDAGTKRGHRRARERRRLWPVRSRLRREALWLSGSVSARRLPLSWPASCLPNKGMTWRDTLLLIVVSLAMAALGTALIALAVRLLS